MYIWGSIMGFITAIVPCALLQFLFGSISLGRLKNRHFKGILFSLFVWLIAGGVIYADLRFDIIGVMKKETGPTLMELYRHSHFGFLASGLMVSLFAGFLGKQKEE